MKTIKSNPDLSSLWQDFVMPFLVLKNWIFRNVVLLCCIQILIGLATFYQYSLTPPEFHGSARISTGWLHTKEIHGFFEAIRYAEFSNKAVVNFTKKTGNEARIQSIRLYIPKYGEENRIDTNGFRILFDLERAIPKFHSSQLMDILEPEIYSDPNVQKVMRKNILRKTTIENQLDSLRRQILILQQLGIPDSKLSFLGTLQRQFETDLGGTISKTKLSLGVTELQITESKNKRPALIIGLICEIVLCVFFLLRFLITGK